MRHVIRWCTIVGALICAPAIAQAQGTYPDRPIRFVVAFPPGGATDTFFRLISNELADRARPVGRDREQGRRRRLHRLAGGRGLAGRRLHGVGGRERDRHQSGAVQEASVRLQPAHATMTRSARWAARRWCGRWPTMSRPTARPEFVAWSKTVPSQFNYGHAGPGSVSHLVPEVILDGAGMQALPVPFKGGGPAAAAVAGGHVAVVTSSLPVAKTQIEGKLVKGLLVTSAKRSPALAGRADAEGAWRQGRRSGPGILVGPVCAEGHAGADPGQDRKGPARPPWRTPPCASGLPGSTPTRRSRRARRCGSSSRTRSRTGRSSSTPRASRSSNDVSTGKTLARHAEVTAIGGPRMTDLDQIHRQRPFRIRHLRRHDAVAQRAARRAWPCAAANSAAAPSNAAPAWC